jgi:hypothetical protein
MMIDSIELIPAVAKVNPTPDTEHLEEQPTPEHTKLCGYR